MKPMDESNGGKLEKWAQKADDSRKILKEAFIATAPAFYYSIFPIFHVRRMPGGEIKAHLRAG